VVGQLKKIKGDLITLAKSGEFDIIVHGCNCFHTMNSGIAGQIKREWPMALRVDEEFSEYGDFLKLGTATHCIQKLDNGDYLGIFNAYTQFKYGKGNGAYDKDVLVDYNALRNAFALIIASIPKKRPMRVGIPKIGAGLAGGDWDYIEPCIEERFAKTIHELTLVEYEN